MLLDKSHSTGEEDSKQSIAGGGITIAASFFASPIRPGVEAMPARDRMLFDEYASRRGGERHHARLRRSRRDSASMDHGRDKPRGGR